MWITRTGVNYTFYKIERDSTLSSTPKPHGQHPTSEYEDYIVRGHRVLLEYKNSNPSPSLKPLKKLKGYHNYFLGSDSSKYASFVGLYQEVIIRNVYKGIHIRYYFGNGFLRYDFLLDPGVDPSLITFELKGCDDQYGLDDKIVFTTRFGKVELTDLKTFQNNKTLKSKFHKRGNDWKIYVESPDPSYPLTIDPLVFSTFFGG